MEWQNRAACKDVNTELFFPVQGNLTDQQYWQASEICKECPVNVACLKMALDQGISNGLFCLPERVRKRFKNKKIDNLSNTVKETFKIMDIIDPSFNSKGKLIKKRCLRCNRYGKGFAADCENWGAKSHICVSCYIEIENNKHIDKLLEIEKKPSKSMPEFDDHGILLNKKCTKCWKRKDTKDFTKRPKGIGSRTSWCKVCLNKNLQDWHNKKNDST
jgi:WhiB family redox-sensing transcriptional regulator